VRVMLTCWHCHHQADADLPALIAAGHGDVPLILLRGRCARCKSDRIDMICTSHARVLPWDQRGRRLGAVIDVDGTGLGSKLNQPLGIGVLF
jgi:hypothetical protein